MPTVELFEKWDTTGPWEFTRPVSVDANGVLTVDADTNGVCSFYPAFGVRHYAHTDTKRHGYMNPHLSEFKFTFTTMGSFATVGFVSHPALGVSHHHKYEFSYDGTGVRFFARGASNFDGQTLIPGNSIKVRVSCGPSEHRLAVCSADGTLIAADTTNSMYTLDYTGYPSYGSYETPNTAYTIVTGTSENPSYGSNAVFLTVRSGIVKVDPIRVLTVVSESPSTAVATGTSAQLKARPATPTFTVTPYDSGLSRISTTSPDSITSIVMTRNRGMFFTGANSIIEDTSRMQCSGSATLAFTASRPSVFRAVAVNGAISDVQTLYVGPTTQVAVPEISVSRIWVGPKKSGCIKMSCADSGASIRYTLDGTEPTETSALYTEPLFIKNSAFLRAKSFSGALSSITVNATYVNSGLAIPNPYDTSLWLYNGNATFTESSITVNDPTGIGVAFREDAYEVSSYASQDGSAKIGAGSFKYVASFQTSGPFRMKVPGTDAHVAWVGNAAGLVANTSATPTTSMGGATYAKVTITGNKYISASYTYMNECVIQGYTAGDVLVATVTLKYETQPLGIYSNVLGFTSEGISAFTLTNLSLSMTTSVGTGLDSGVPLIDTATRRNIAGAVAPAAITTDSSSMDTWDIERNWPMDYKARIDWRIEDIQGLEYGIRTDNLLSVDNVVSAYYGDTATDSANAAWFSTKLFLGNYCVPIISKFRFGWSNTSVSGPAITINRAPGVSEDIDTASAVGGGSRIQIVTASSDLSSVSAVIKQGLKYDLVWRCGRKTIAGVLYVRTILLDDGADPVYKPIINNIVYDSGWVSCGAVSSVLPRPMFKIRGPLLSMSGDNSMYNFGNHTVTIRGDLTETQVENYMTLGGDTPLELPSIVAGEMATNGTYPVTVTCAGSTSIVTCAGNRPLQLGGGASANRWSGSSISVPEISNIRSIGISSVTGAVSAIATSYVGLDTADYINVTTRPGIALIRVLPRTKTYLPTVTTAETIWSLWLNGVRIQEIDLTVPGDLEMHLESGSYSAVICREIKACRNAGIVGTTPTPIVFSVPETLDVSVVAPTTVVAGAVASFAASSTETGVTYKWTFSDGTVATTSNTDKTFTKPGKYRWALVVTSSGGDSVQQAGSIVARFTPGLTPATNLTVGTAERVS